MAGVFDADCPDCGFHWEGIAMCLHIGPRFRLSPDDTRSLSCPRCYRRVYYPASMERKAWQRWCEQFLHESPFQSSWLSSLLARIDTSIEAQQWYVPSEFNPGEVVCPACNLPMVSEGSIGERVTCPQCGSAAPAVTFTGFATLTADENGFE
jgi:hypothetical protein